MPCHAMLISISLAVVAEVHFCETVAAVRAGACRASVRSHHHMIQLARFTSATRAAVLAVFACLYLMANANLL